MSTPIYVRVKLHDLITLARTANKALKGNSNDAEHDALHAIREELIDIVKMAPLIKPRR